MPIKRPNQEYNTYNLLGKNYHWKWLKSKATSYNDYIQIILNDILNLVNLTNSQSILDAGCGDGVLLYLLNKSNNNLNLHGFDFIESAIKYAKKKLKKKAELYVFDIRDINHMDKEYDLTVCTETIDHVLPPTPLPSFNDLRLFHLEILTKLIEIAKKGAYFTIPATEEWRPPDQKLKENEEPLLEEWLENLEYRSNWRYLTTDKNNPRGTYIVEIIK